MCSSRVTEFYLHTLVLTAKRSAMHRARTRANAALERERTRVRTRVLAHACKSTRASKALVTCEQYCTCNVVVLLCYDLSNQLSNHLYIVLPIRSLSSRTVAVHLRLSSVMTILFFLCRTSESNEVILYCDFHGHSRKQNIFIYGCDQVDNPLTRLRSRIFPKMLSKNAPTLFSYKESKFGVHKSKVRYSHERDSDTHT